MAAPTLVQSNSSFASATTSGSCGFASTPSSSDLIVVWVMVVANSGNPPVPTVTDNHGNLYQDVIQASNGLLGIHGGYCFKPTVGSPFTVTASTGATTVSQLIIVIEEFTYPSATIQAGEVFNGGSVTLNPGGQTAVDIGTYSQTFPLIDIASVGWVLSATQSVFAGTGFTLDKGSAGADTEYETFASAPASVDAKFSIGQGGGTVNWVGAMMVFGLPENGLGEDDGLATALGGAWPGALAPNIRAAASDDETLPFASPPHVVWEEVGAPHVTSRRELSPTVAAHDEEWVPHIAPPTPHTLEEPYLVIYHREEW